MGSPKTKNDKLITPEEHHDENEAATVVIDIDQFRKELDSVKLKATNSEPVAIEFKVHNNQDEENNEDENLPGLPPETALSLDLLEEGNEELDISLSKKVSIKTLLFDFKSSKLSELYSSYQSDSFDFRIINDLADLNKEIKTDQELIIIFYYNQAPKAINTLMKQLNKKFSHIQTMIIADNLSEKKAIAHGKTDSGARSYLSTPASFNEVEDKLSLLVESLNET